MLIEKVDVWSLMTILESIDGLFTDYINIDVLILVDVGMLIDLAGIRCLESIIVILMSLVDDWKRNGFIGVPMTDSWVRHVTKESMVS